MPKNTNKEKEHKINISKLFIYGDFYTLNFQEVIISESEFHKYNNFSNCLFSDNSTESTFNYVSFNYMNIPNSKGIHSKLFNKCHYNESNIEEVAKGNSIKQEKEEIKIYKSIQFVCKKIDNSRKSLKVLKNGKNIKYNKGELVFLDKLISIGLLQQDVWKGEDMYMINKKYYDSLPDIKMGEFPEELEEKINKVFEL